MLVVSDTSPLSNLAIVDRLDFLKRRYGKVCIPKAVATELAALTHVKARQSIEAAIFGGWLIVDERPRPSLSLIDRATLDLGEADAIALALGIRADLLLIDEKKGRHVARTYGLAVSGVLGELLHAKRRQWIFELRPEIVRLRADARFFVTEEIEKLILKEAGE